MYKCIYWQQENSDIWCGCSLLPTEQAAVKVGWKLERGGTEFWVRRKLGLSATDTNSCQNTVLQSCGLRAQYFRCRSYASQTFLIKLSGTISEL